MENSNRNRHRRYMDGVPKKMNTNKIEQTINRVYKHFMKSYIAIITLLLSGALYKEHIIISIILGLTGTIIIMQEATHNDDNEG